MRVMFWLLVLVIVVVLGFGYWVYSGRYDAAATSGQSPLTSLLVNTIQRQSVRARASKIESPPIGDETAIAAGAMLYRERCQTCHGGPGVPSADFARALLPPALELTDQTARWSASELFWITTNGIRMSGMPPYARILSDEERWQIVGFLQQLPAMDATRYRQMTGQ